MRVLLCHQPTDGGVGRHVRDLTEGLQASGCEIVLASPAIPHGPGRTAAHRQLDLRRAITPRHDLTALMRLAAIVRGVRPDVIHAHSSKAGAIARLARPLFPRTPVVYTPHGYAFAGYFAHARERLAYRGAERALAPLTSRVVCVCADEGRLASSIGPRDRVRVIHNGIAAVGGGLVEPRIAEVSQRGPVIGALTLLRPGKGVETLIEAAPHLLSRHPSAQIAIVGGGPDAERLRALTHGLGVAHAVHFLGPSADTLSMLRGMHIFVHPSWAEAFPYAVLEAMSVARPIVASKVGGVGEAVIDGETGLLAAARDAPALARALAELLDEPKRAARLGEEALRRVRERFTLAGMIDGVRGVYEELVRPCAPGPDAGSPRRAEAAAGQSVRAGLYVHPDSDDD